MKKIISVIIVIIILVLGYSAYKGWQSSNQLEKDQPIENQYEEPFQRSAEGMFFGSLTLTGYLDIKTRVCEPDNMCGQTVEYASFIVTETDNDLIYDFIELSKGNSFIASNGVGLGCYQEDQNRIYSRNFGDIGGVDNIVSGDDLEKLLSSDQDNLVRIQITKPILSAGSGAPDCYSHFREFKVF